MLTVQATAHALPVLKNHLNWKNQKLLSSRPWPLRRIKDGAGYMKDPATK
jgi:hypothetical protein